MVRRAEYVYSVTLSILSVMSMAMALIPVDNLIIMQFSILNIKLYTQVCWVNMYIHDSLYQYYAVKTFVAQHVVTAQI